MKKIIILFITSIILASIPVSANAYDLTTTIKPTGRQWEWGQNSYWYETQLNGDGEYNWATTNWDIYWGNFMNNNRTDNTWILKGATTGNNIDFKEGLYYKTGFQITIQGYTFNNVNYGVQIPQINRIVFPNNTPYELISVKPTETKCLEQVSGTLGIQNPTTPTSISAQNTCFRGYIKYEFILRATRNDTGKLILGNNSGWMLQSYVGIAKNWNLGFLFTDKIIEYEESDATAINQQQQEAGEQAQNDGQQESSSGQQSAESATQNGFQTLGTIIGAFTDTPSGDCTINGNLGNVDLGTLNFCQGNIEPIRPIIRAVIYLVMALGTYKLTMWIIGSIAGLVNYVQTGNEE